MRIKMYFQKYLCCKSENKEQDSKKQLIDDILNHGFEQLENDLNYKIQILKLGKINKQY